MKCFDYFLNLVSRRDYSEWELRKKAQDKGFEAEEILTAIEQLQNSGYQSDYRLVENLILSGKRKYGKPVLKRKCLEKGIPGAIFDQVWAEAEADTETETLDNLGELKAKVQRKYKITDFQKLDPKIKAKVYNYLQYRGFNPFQLLQKWQEDEEDCF